MGTYFFIFAQKRGKKKKKKSYKKKAALLAKITATRWTGNRSCFFRVVSHSLNISSVVNRDIPEFVDTCHGRSTRNKLFVKGGLISLSSHPSSASHITLSGFHLEHLLCAP